MRIISILFILILSFPSTVMAATWTRYKTVYSWDTPSYMANCRAYANQTGGISRVISIMRKQTAGSEFKPACQAEYTRAAQSELDSTDFENSTIYGINYTDEQCEASYGGSREISGLPQDLGGQSRTTVNLGACRVTSSGGVMPCYNNDDGTQSCLSNWVAESTGDENDVNSESGIVEEPLFQQTDDPASCSNGYYSSGGNSYCYTGSSQPTEYNVDENGNVIDDSNDDGNSGGGDGGSSGGDGGSDGGTDGGDSGSGGGSGGGGSSGGGSGDGGSSGGDSGAGDSELGDGLDAVLDAIAGVRSAINDGFNNLVDKVTGVSDAVDDVKASVDEGNQAAEDRFSAMADGAPTQADYDAKYGSDEGNAGLVNQAVEGLGSDLSKYVDGTDDTLTSVVDDMQSWGQSMMPTIPAPSCAPLIFAPGEVYSFTIDCEIFELIRDALAWIMYALTAYVVITTMFNARPH